MAYLTPKGKNKYEIRWTDHQNGTKPSITFIGNKTQAEAQLKKWEEKEKQVRNGFAQRLNMDTTIEVLEEWYFRQSKRDPVGLQWKNLYRQTPLNEKTVYLQKKSFKNFMSVFGKDCLVSSMDSALYRQHFINRKLNGLNVDIRAMISVINTAIRHKDKIVKSMPSDLKVFTVDHGTPFYLERGQVNKILSLNMNEYYAKKPLDFDIGETMRIFSLYLETGCRLNELLSLTWDKVSFADKSITVTGKRNKVRKVFLTENACNILMSITDRVRPMPYTNTKVRQRLTDICRYSGISFTTHNLRSTCGSFMLSLGCSIEEVSEHLGHEDIQTTRKWYARIIDAKRRSAIEKMNDLSRYVTTEPQPLVDRPTA